MDTRPRDGRVLRANANADPDTIVPCGWPGCEVPVRLGRPVCAAHLDEMNIAYQLRRDRRCPDCGEPSPFGVLLRRCGSQEEGRD
jgi:hypothetical protein